MTTEIENWQLLLFSGEEDNRALALAMSPNFDFKDVANALAISYLKLSYTQSSAVISADIQAIIDSFAAQAVDIIAIFNDNPICFEEWDAAGRWWSAWIDSPLELSALDKIELLALGARHIGWVLSELFLRADWHQLLTAAQWQAALASWTHDEWLTLANMRTLERLPDAVFQCSNLRGLRIYAPKLASFPVGLLYQLQNLEALHFHQSNLSGLAIDLRRLPKLRALTFRGKEKLLKLNIEGREQLESLDLLGNPVMRLPLWVRDLSGLKQLNLGQMNFAAFPPAVLALKNLEELHLTETRFTKFPDGFAQLPALRYLDISGGHFYQLPDFFADLPKLEYLNLSRCNFKEIPSILAAMPALRELDMADNFIRKIDLPNLRLLFARLHRLNLRASFSFFALETEIIALAAEFANLRLEIK